MSTHPPDARPAFTDLWRTLDNTPRWKYRNNPIWLPGRGRGHTQSLRERRRLWLYLAAIMGVAVCPGNMCQCDYCCPILTPDEVQSVLWQYPDSCGGGYCRIAEDGSLASVPGDLALPHPDSGTLVPAHPWDLLPDRNPLIWDAWEQLAAEYKIIPPGWQAPGTRKEAEWAFRAAIYVHASVDMGRRDAPGLPLEGWEEPPGGKTHLADDDATAVLYWPARRFGPPVLYAHRKAVVGADMWRKGRDGQAKPRHHLSTTLYPHVRGQNFPQRAESGAPLPDYAGAQILRETTLHHWHASAHALVLFREILQAGGDPAAVHNNSFGLHADDEGFRASCDRLYKLRKEWYYWSNQMIGQQKRLYAEEDAKDSEAAE